MPRPSARHGRTTSSTSSSTISGAPKPDFVDDAPRLLQSIAAKSGRYVAEMDEISAAHAQAGLESGLLAAFSAVYAQLSTTGAAAGSPEKVDPDATLDDVLEWIDGPPVRASEEAAGRGAGAAMRRTP